MQGTLHDVAPVMVASARQGAELFVRDDFAKIRLQRRVEAHDAYSAASLPGGPRTVNTREGCASMQR